jgi:hypothetical protein
MAPVPGGCDEAQQQFAGCLGSSGIGVCPTPGNNSTRAPGTLRWAADEERHRWSSVPKITSTGRPSAVSRAGMLRCLR